MSGDPADQFKRLREDMTAAARRGDFGPIFQRWVTPPRAFATPESISAEDKREMRDTFRVLRCQGSSVADALAELVCIFGPDHALVDRNDVPDGCDYPGHPDADRMIAIAKDIDVAKVDRTGGVYDQVRALLAERDHRNQRAAADAMGLRGDWDTDDVEEALVDAFATYRAARSAIHASRDGARDLGPVIQRWSAALPPSVALGDADPCAARSDYNDLVRDLAMELGLDPEDTGGGDVVAAVRAGACGHGVFMTKACPSCYRYPSPLPQRPGGPGFQGEDYRSDLCKHEPSGGCMWCCQRCNYDDRCCPGCGTVADHRDTPCPGCAPRP